MLSDGQRLLDFKLRLSAFLVSLWLFKLPWLGQCSLLWKTGSFSWSTDQDEAWGGSAGRAAPGGPGGHGWAGTSCFLALPIARAAH